MQARSGRIGFSLRLALTLWCLLSSSGGCAIDVQAYRLLDLTHAFNADTIYWPTSTSDFEYHQLAQGETAGGWFYSAGALSTPEHGGTHMDAPIHFYRDRETLDRIPLERLIVPAVVIDVSRETDRNRDYRLRQEDIDRFEKTHGAIPAGAAVLLRTGWDRYWPDVKRYLGDDTPGDASHLSFPSFGGAAVRFLVEQRGVAMLGVDTASIDYGASRDFIVHRVAAEHNVPGLENLKGLDRLPATGATLIALPMKIEGGSGGPARVVAMVPR